MEDRSVSTELRCSRCGHSVPPGDNFCTECGAPVFPEAPRRPLFADEVDPDAAHRPARVAARPAPAPAAARPVRRRHRGAWLLALLLLVVAGGVGYLLGHDRDSAKQAGDAGATQAPTASQPASGAPSSQASTPPSTPAAQPQDQLHQVAKQDDAKVRELVGTWIPQLAALTPGAGGDASWSQALLHYRKLKDAYPTALLLDTGSWPHTYEHGGMYAVVVPLPGTTSTRALTWCRAHVSSPQDCAAKLIDTHGSWADNIDMGKPGPG